MSVCLNKLLNQAEEGYLIRCRKDDSIDIFAKNEYGDTLLHVAVGIGDLEIAEYLIKMGLDINARGECGLTPLACAALSRNVMLISLLLNFGADINITDHLRDTPAEMFMRALKEKGPLCCPDTGTSNSSGQ